MKTRHLLMAATVLLGLIGVVYALTDHYLHLPERASRHETHVVGQDSIEPGSTTHLKVAVRDSSDGQPLTGSEVRVTLRPEGTDEALKLFEGTVDHSGIAVVSFDVPASLAAAEPPVASLVVETLSDLGSEALSIPIRIARDHRVLITTDKPVYQPGQTIHLRALALHTSDRRPTVDQQLEFTVADGKGNKVFRERLRTSKYGVAATDFVLAEEVNSGNFKITASLGDTTSEKTVEVKPYSLPKFEVELTAERDFYLPGDHVAGTLRAEYFFGKPVAGANALLEGFTYDVERTEVFQLHGATDRDGSFPFDFDLPTYLAGTDLEGGLGRFYLQATVTDSTGHAETSNLALTVSEDPLVIEAVPESGTFRPGVENILYLLTSQPDGTPIQSTLKVQLLPMEGSFEVETDQYGLAEIRVTPTRARQTVSIQAHAVNGATSSVEYLFEGGESSEETLLLRPEKPVYRVGETMRLDLLATEPTGSIYLDIVRQGQTLSTRSVSLGEDPTLGPGRATVLVDVGPDLTGTLQLHAYKILPSGQIARDTRLVVVDPANDLHVNLTLDRDSYLPGATAKLALGVSDPQGVGTQALLGLAIVDESVFSVRESDPGFAKLYFLLEQELLTPRYDLHGYQIGDLVSQKPAAEVEEGLQIAREIAAHAALAGAISKAPAFSVQENSHEAVLARLRPRQAAFFQDLFAWSFLLPSGAIVSSLYTALRERRLGRSVVGVVIGVGLLPFLACPLAYILEATTLSLLWVLLGMVTFLLGIAAIRRRCWTRLVFLGLLISYGVALNGLVQAIDAGLVSPGFGGWAALLLGLLTLYTALIMQLSSLTRKAFFNSPMVLSLLIVSLFLGSCATAPTPFSQGSDAQEATPESDGREREQDSADAPRLRQFFPETLLWLPEAETDPEGALDLEIPLADSITTWRMSAFASTQDGRLGSATGQLRVFQDFFIDPDLPQALTVDDEVSIPVAVYNYLPEPQGVRLEIQRSDWFELLDEPEKEMTVDANQVGVDHFRIRVTQFGNQPLRVTAWGDRLSDAVQRTVRVFPNGKERSFTRSDRLSMGATEIPVAFPETAIPGTQSLALKVYPGVASQLVEGLESILRMPYGCFEQTSSAAYPNVLVLDYLHETDQLAPEIQFKAEEYVNIGYQRLTTFEVPSGGFSLFGRPPADRMLTAYGLMEFNDMSRVHNVDPEILERTAAWLLAQQKEDGSWDNDRGFLHEPGWQGATGRLPSTAYILWALADAGTTQEESIQQARRFLLQHQAETDSPYVLGLIANALVATDLHRGGALSAATETTLDRLAARAHREGEAAYWESDAATYMGSRGRTADVVTTALATHAFLRAERHPDLASAGLTALIQRKDSYGTWYSTEATVMALKALRESAHFQGEEADARVTFSLSDGQSRTLRITPDNFDVVQMIVFDELQPGEAYTLTLQASGEGNLMYQVTGRYYLPWSRIQEGPERPLEALSIDLSYDRTRLQVEDTVAVDVTVTMNAQGARAEWAIVDLGIPPGFRVLREDLEALVALGESPSSQTGTPTVERYELTGRQILLYLSGLRHGAPLTFRYRLQAKYPLTAQTPPSLAYDYYNPEVSGKSAPIQIIVEERAETH